MSTFIKYDYLPFQDFRIAYLSYVKRNQKGFFIDIVELREFLYQGYKTKSLQAQNVTFPLKIFYLTDFDIIRSSYNHYFLFQSPSPFQEELEKLAKRIKIELKLKNIDSLFRIDPKYGLIVGTSKDSIETHSGKDKPFCFITLYLTGDYHHPEIALYDYIEKEHKKRYIEIFEQHNHCTPGSLKFLGIDFSKMRTAFTKSSPAVILTYDNIMELGNSLVQKHKLESLTLSLIYEDVSEVEATLCLLDKKKSAFFMSGMCKFFINVEELFRS